jgi:serine/threonine-protein kinase
MIGTKLAHYEITHHLGTGGMGEVYQATDSRLGRSVAIKLLPEAFTHDTERVARFEREARVLASLNHPNSAAIYGVEESAGRKFLVMELVPGETLADRLIRGPIPVDESMNIARQVCEALEAAHENGVIHRDLKPANIKVTLEGVVKVLDFGLATMVQKSDAENASNVHNSPTVSRSLGTESGVILGTAPYMSPEQAAGKAVDKRSDIWSFGVVLFEMLTGERLFPNGETISYVLADVLRAPIDFSRLPAATPSAVRDLLGRCLDRDVKRRLRDIGEARVAIDMARKTSTSAVAAPVAKRAGMKPWWIAALAAVVIAGIAGAGWWRATRPVERPLLRFTDNTEEEVRTDIAFGPSIAISPDGLRIVLVTAASDGSTRLSTRLMSSSKLSVISGTEGISPVSPFFSPDGLWLGFFSESKLKKIPVEGGAPITLCDVGGSGAPRGGFWGEDQNILFATQRSPVMRVSSSGGTPVPATTLGKNEVTNRFAQLLPGSEAFLFTASSDNNVWEDASIEVQTIKTRERKTLMKGGYFGRYVAGQDGKGYLLYIRDDAVFAAPMDVKHLQLTGPGIPVLEDVSGLPVNGFGQLDVARSGTFVYISGSIRHDRLSLGLMDTSGAIQTLAAPQAAYVGVRPSPDGTRIMVRVSDASGTNLAVYELASGRTTRLTFVHGAIANIGIWTPDSKHIVFPLTSSELSGPGFYWIRADGGGEPQRLTDRYSVPWSFSPDGKRLAYFTGPGYGSDEFGIWTLPLNLDDPEHPKAGKPDLFLKATAAVQNPVFSPDGRWIAYISAETNKLQAYVRPFVPGSPGAGGRWQISTDGATSVFWSTVGHELIYASQSSSGIVPYSANGDSFVASSPQPILKNLSPLQASPSLMPDGKHFAVVTSTADPIARQTHVGFLLNFPDELERRAAAAGASK